MVAPARWWMMLSAIALGLTGVGCAEQRLSVRATEYVPQRARTVFLPAMVALYSLDEHGELGYQDRPSQHARVITNGQLRVLAASSGSRVVELTQLTATSPPWGKFYVRMDDATTGIVHDWIKHPFRARTLPPAGSLGPELASWQPLLDADYVVFLKFKGSYETQARRTKNIVVNTLTGGTLVYARRIATASVVDLRQAKIVRIEGVEFDSLQNSENVRALLDQLITSVQR